MPIHPPSVDFEVFAFPPPYQGMVAVNSDVEFTDWPVQLDLVELLHGYGLETAFSFWLFGPAEMGWRMFEDDDTPTPESAAAVSLVQAGVLDTLHSYGDRSRGDRIDRGRITFGLDWMSARGAVPRVYTNHGSEADRQNVGGDWATYQEGDLPGSLFHHLDLTRANGLEFFWTDRDYDNERWSFDAAATDQTGLFVGQRGRDGTPMLRFRRYRGALKKGAPTATSFAEQLGPILAAPPNGYLVIYQHLGCFRNIDGKPYPAHAPYFDAAGREALVTMATHQREGRYLVTTTDRLLRHASIAAAKRWNIDVGDDRVRVRFDETIAVHGIERRVSWDDLSGWTMKLRRPMTAEFALGLETRVVESWRSGNTWSAGLPWRPLDIGGALVAARQSSARLGSGAR